jgi:hypothetical protein
MQRCAELEELTRRLYEAVVQGDVAFFERHLSRGQTCVVIGTAPGEWWETYDAAIDRIRAQMAVATGSVALTPGELRAYREGNVGWVADRPTFKLAAVAKQCRHTSVLVQSDDQWQIVQHHFSIGVPNEQAFGTEAAKLG